MFWELSFVLPSFETRKQKKIVTDSVKPFYISIKLLCFDIWKKYLFKLNCKHTIPIIHRQARIFHLCLFEPAWGISHLPHSINERRQGVSFNSQSCQQLLTVQKHNSGKHLGSRLTLTWTIYLTCVKLMFVELQR